MAKAAVLESTSSVAILPLGRFQSGVKMKRKTPSELRGEQLKRHNGGTLAGDKFASALPSEKFNSGLVNGTKKPESAKVPRYISTCVDEVYPVRKSSERCRALYGKDKVKPEIVARVEMPTDLDNPFVAQNIPSENKTSHSCCKAGAAMTLEHSDSSAKGCDDQGFRKLDKCSQNALRNVVEIHLGNEKSLDSTKVDIEKALKGLAVRDKSAICNSFIDSSRKNHDLPSISSRKLFLEFHISGHRAPLDLTLKTTFRLMSSSSVKWCQRLNATPAIFEIGQPNSEFSFNMDKRSVCTSGHSINSEVMYSKALCSWTFPQSSLPTSIITAMTLSATKGETDFLLRRQQDWEDSFRNLYFMLRKNICNMFYVYTSQFVVLFICNKSLGKKQSCNAYLSQSTCGLRSLLRKHDVCFSMPLCRVEVEQATEADLIELSEIEKHNFGQAFHQDSVSMVDNRPQSLLAFIGNEYVHGLYDFLLNYRLVLNSLSGADVPALYAPVPFPNASLCIPEVKCKEMKRADAIIPSSSGSDADDTNAALSPSASSVCFSIELKDTILPPWVICRLCAAMGADGRTFESTFITDPLSIGLNIALESFCRKTEPLGNVEILLPESGDELGLPEAALSPCLQSAALTRLKYCKGSYIAYVTQI